MPVPPNFSKFTIYSKGKNANGRFLYPQKPRMPTGEFHIGTVQGGI
jgi:hypothetical protein